MHEDALIEIVEQPRALVRRSDVQWTKQWLGVFAACSACTGPPESQELPASADEDLVRPRPQYSFRHLPDAPIDPGPPPGFVGFNPGCPSVRVFADVEDLCEHGILPLQPVGSCARMRASDEQREGHRSAFNFPKVEIAALGGHAELFERYYMRTDDRHRFYLALRGTNGYVLLADAGEFYSQSNDPPELVRFIGDDTSLELRTRQRWYV